MGFLKERYLFRMDGNGIGIDHRSEVAKELLVLPEDSTDIRENVRNNPKWISSLFYTLLFGIFTVLGIQMIFRNRIYSMISGVFYFVVLLLSGGIILLSAQFNSFETFKSASAYFFVRRLGFILLINTAQ